jgi:hypothetical protein
MSDTAIRSAAIACLVLLAGCATWSTASVERKEYSGAVASTDPARITVSEGDANRQYVSLGDITVTVNKTTIFNNNPSREMVNEKLKEKAAELGADAVILVRYGEGGMTLMSWGALEGKGRAIKYQP